MKFKPLDVKGFVCQGCKNPCVIVSIVLNEYDGQWYLVGSCGTCDAGTCVSIKELYTAFVAKGAN